MEGLSGETVLSEEEEEVIKILEAYFKNAKKPLKESLKQIIEKINKSLRANSEQKSGPTEDSE